MKKMSAALTSVLHALVIAAILFVIFFGLYRLGLVELPEPVARLFGEKDTGFVASGDDAANDTEPGTTSYEKITLTEQSVRTMLSSVSLPKQYTLEVRSTLYEGEKSRATQLIIRHDGRNDAAYFLDEGDVSKQVISDGKTVYVNTFDGDTARTVEYSRGDITFEQQIGAVYTYASFLEKADDEAYTFELVTSDGDVYMLITFDDVSGAYVQKQSYKLDPDNGIVVEAYSYEGDTLIFSGVVTSMTESLSQTSGIPENYLALENEIFSHAEQQQ